MSVLTMPATATTADYTALPYAVQTQFDQLMERADTTIDAGDYNALMQAAAHLTGITIAPGGDIVRCACPHCHNCAAVFDTAQPGLRACGDNNRFNLPQLQCPPCADTHPHDVDA